MFVLLIFLALAMATYFILLAQNSRTGKPPGLVEGRLARCPNKPNCICSEYPDDAAHYEKPIDMGRTDAREIMARLKTIIEKMGGRIETESDDYIASSFSSTVFGFVDDLELRADLKSELIHIRSASRAGTSDLGVNRKRVEKLRGQYIGYPEASG